MILYPKDMVLHEAELNNSGFPILPIFKWHLLSDLDRVVKLIQSKRPELSEEEIISLMGQRKDRSSGLLSDMGAGELVAHDLLVELEARESKTIRLNMLTPGLNDVNVGAWIVAQWPSQSFDRKGGGRGILLKLLLADETGTIQCVIWNAKAEELEKFGDLTRRCVKILHGYTKESPTNAVELQCGDRSDIVLLDDVGQKEIDIFSKISQLREDRSPANVRGVSRSQPRTIPFKRGGSEGKVVKITLIDDTGSIDLVGWDEHGEVLEKIPQRSVVEVISGRIRKNAWAHLELHADKMSIIRVVGSSDAEVAPLPRLKIAELKPGIRINVAGKVLAIGKLREVRNSSGEVLQLRPLLIGDSTGICELSLWNQQALLAENLNIDEPLLLEEVVPKQRLGSLTLSLGVGGRMVTGKEVEDPGSPPFSRLAELSESTLVNIVGTVSSRDDKRAVTTSKGETVEMTALRLSDDTGQVRVTFWRELAAEAEKLPVGGHVRIYALRGRKAYDGLELASTPLTRVEVLSK